MGTAKSRFAIVPWMVVEKLNAQEMGLYVSLALHADKYGWCWPSQHTLASICKMSQPWVVKTLRNLEDRMVIERLPTPQGTKYRLPVSSTLYPEGYHENEDGYHKPYHDDDINNKNTTNNNIPPIVPRKRVTSVKDVKPIGWEGDFNEDFDFLWSLYPRKIGKSVAKKALEKAARKVTAADLHASLLKTLARWKKEGREEQHIPHFATWLNQERWLDDA